MSQRRTLLVAVCALWLIIGLAPLRSQVVSLWWSPSTQGYLVAYTDKGTAATIALIQYGQRVGAHTTGRTTVADTSGNFSLRHGQTFGGADEIEAILVATDSPAAGSGTALLEASTENGIDAAYPLAMFLVESGMATNPAYAYVGRHNPGNVMGTSGPVAYLNWADGWRAQVKLLADYRDGNGFKRHATVREAIGTWAPQVENDTNGYADLVEATVTGWRNVSRGAFVADGPLGEVAQQNGAIDPVGAFSVVIPMSDCKRVNIVSAYTSSPGLREIAISPGGSFDFNGQWRIDDQTLVQCGVYGGGVCSYAAGLSYVARHIGLKVESVDHGTVFEPGLDRAAQIAIWSSGGPGGQDLRIYGDAIKKARFSVAVGGTELTIKGWTE